MKNIILGMVSLGLSVILLCISFFYIKFYSRERWHTSYNNLHAKR